MSWLCESVLGLCVCLRETAPKHPGGREWCVMESASCQTIVLQQSQGEGRAWELLGKEGMNPVKGWGSQGGQSPRSEGQERLRFPSRGRLREMLGTGCMWGRILERYVRGRHLWDLHFLKAVSQDLEGGRWAGKGYVRGHLQHHPFPSLRQPQ